MERERKAGRKMAAFAPFADLTAAMRDVSGASTSHLASHLSSVTDKVTAVIREEAAKHREESARFAQSSFLDVASHFKQLVGCERDEFVRAVLGGGCTWKGQRIEVPPSLTRLCGGEREAESDDQGGGGGDTSIVVGKGGVLSLLSFAEKAMDTSLPEASPTQRALKLAVFDRVQKLDALLRSRRVNTQSLFSELEKRLLGHKFVVSALRREVVGCESAIAFLGGQEQPNLMDLVCGRVDAGAFGGESRIEKWRREKKKHKKNKENKELVGRDR